MEKLEVHIQRGVVIGRVVDLKATNSNRRLPVHPNLADLLLEYNAETSPRAGNCDWLVPSPYGTGHPRWPWTIIRDPLLPAGLPPGLGSVGLHYFYLHAGGAWCDAGGQQQGRRNDSTNKESGMRKRGGKRAAMRVPKDAKSFHFRPTASSQLLVEPAPSNFSLSTRRGQSVREFGFGIRRCIVGTIREQ